MKNFKYILIFICGCLSGIYFCWQKVPSFLVSSAPLDFSESIDPNGVNIIHCSPRNSKHGEVWLGLDIERSLKNVFSYTDIVYDLEEISHNSLVNIYLRGYMQFSPPFPDDGHINIAYVIYPVYFSHADDSKIRNRGVLRPADYGFLQVLFDETQFYDALAVASVPYVKKMRQAGYQAYYVPQFTNTDKFYYEYDDKLKSEVLFVGGRPYLREAPMIALRNGLPISIYGPDSNGIALAEYIDNDVLHKYYSSAKIVLNDHRKDMRENGFINNRTYDVTACGTLLISDYMPEIEEIYGDSVPMWKTEDELVALVKYYLDPAHEKERLEKAKRAQAITLQHFTADKIAERFEEIIDEIKKDKGL